MESPLISEIMVIAVVVCLAGPTVVQKILEFIDR